MKSTVRLLTFERNYLAARSILLVGLAVALLIMASWRWRALVPTAVPALGDELLGQAADRAGLSTDRQIERLQARLRQAPDDWQSLSQLGVVYLQKARETGDPLFYQKAEAALQQALALQPGDYTAAAAQGALALARHQFDEALEWGERARQANPYRTYAYGVMADAQIELGRYREAEETLQAMVDLRPDLASYARISYLRELYGDTGGAIELMQWAVDSGAPHLENTAWTRTQLGHLYFNQGNLTAAEAEYQRTLQDWPGYAYALAGLGRVRAAQGRTAEAVEALTEASERVPLPEFILPLIEIYTATEQPAEAQQYHALLDTICRLYQANGVDLDLEIALYRADYGLDLPDTLVQARRAYERRPSVYAADVLAWTLYQAGQYSEAQHYADEALHLGTRDALKLFHAGMIYAQLGQSDQARQYLTRALAINPYFSLVHAPAARRMLQELAPVAPAS